MDNGHQCGWWSSREELHGGVELELIAAIQWLPGKVGLCGGVSGAGPTTGEG